METHGALGGAVPSLPDANRHLRDVLTKKGCAIDGKKGVLSERCSGSFLLLPDKLQSIA